jgi:hypothetical protein
MRPIYETESDLEKEREIGKSLSRAWKASLHKLPRAYNVDWMLVNEDGQAKAFVELKSRSNRSTQYPTLMLSLHKWMHGKAMAKEIGGVFLIVVKWTDGLYYHRQGDCEVTYGVGGRTDRGDAQDVEPVVHIPVDAFKMVVDVS